MQIESHSIEETKKVAGEFLNTFLSKVEPRSGATIIGLRGNLGSGKTTFTKAIAEHLGIKNTVTSPTFVIEKIYRLQNQDFTNLIHIDAYRLKNGEDLKVLGWEEVLKNPENIIFIEWPENVEDILPNNTKYINFKFMSENVREINY